MYDPKFEKAIQQKMEELEFRPPESVWVNIEKAVVVKRRRRAGFLWRYLLPAVFVVAAAGLYWRYAGSPATSRSVRGSRTDKDGTGLAASRPTGVGNEQAVSTAPTGRGAANRLTARDEATAQAGHSSAGMSIGKPALAQRSGGSRPAHRISMAGHVASNGHSRSASSVAGEASSADQTTDLVETMTTGGAGYAARSAAGQKGPVQGFAKAPAKGPDAWFYFPGLVDQRLIPQVQSSALSTKKTNSFRMAGLSHPPRRWEAGFVAGGGLSSLNKLNSGQARVAVAPSTSSFYVISNQNSGSHSISNVHAEASFEGGIYLQRPLSDRWIIHTGMNLHYYSNRISVGQQVTTYVQPSYSYLLSTTVQTAATTSMYSAGDTRSVINKYYFLELPIGLEWKINKSHLLPIFVEGDVSLSRLMGASALFYNAKTGLYSKDGNIARKTQFNIGSAVLVGLPFHGVNIQLGPQIQYGVTALTNTQGVGDQHLLYTGIRLVVIPGRK